MLTAPPPLVSTTRFSATCRGTCGLFCLTGLGGSGAGALFVPGTLGAAFAALSVFSGALSVFFPSVWGAGAGFGSTLKISSRLST